MFSNGKSRFKKKQARKEKNATARSEGQAKSNKQQKGSKPTPTHKDDQAPPKKDNKGRSAAQQQVVDERRERDKSSGASSASSRKKFLLAGRKGGDIIEMFRQKLEGSTFRLLNEQIYTSPNSFASQLLAQRNTYDDYHNGYRRQLDQWPLNPNQIIIDALRGDQRGRFIQNKAKSIPGYIPTSWQIADMGCGDAQIAKNLTDESQPRQYTIHSFDLCAGNELVTACDMSNVPLEKNSIEICVFSLSLMATDWISYITEAHRILKPKRLLKIVEIRSRIPNPKKFVEQVANVGFTSDWYDVIGNYFIAFDFIRNEEAEPVLEPYHNPSDVLQPCIYKRR